MDLNLTALLVGLLSAVLLQGAKRAKSIPVNSGQTARLRIVLGVLVLAGNALSAFLNGDLESFVASDQVNLLLNSAVSAVLAHATYKMGLNKLN